MFERLKMAEVQKKQRKDFRFEREAKALKKNLEKLKKQIEERAKLKKEKEHGQD